MFDKEVREILNLTEKVYVTTNKLLGLNSSIQGPEPNYQKVDSNTYNTFSYKNRFEMSHGGILPELNIAYETWGKLNERKDNAVLIFTGLSANSHAKSHEVILNSFQLINK